MDFVPSITSALHISTRNGFRVFIFGYYIINTVINEFMRWLLHLKGNEGWPTREQKGEDIAAIVKDSGIIVLNNEQGFSGQNIRALCDVGNSTKKGSNAGYIGKKGIGFKSTFRVTDAPEIHSNGFHIGFVLPTIVLPCDIDLFSRLASSDTDHLDDQCCNTCIVLPFRSRFLDSTILKCIKFRNLLNDSLIVMRKEIVGNGIIRVSHGKEKMTWFVASKKLWIDAIRCDVQTTKISIALTLHESIDGDYTPLLDQWPVFAFLPLRTYGLKFILQGDFVLPSSREEVDGDSPWNQWLLSEFPVLFVDAQRFFCALLCFRENPGKAVSAFMSFVPLVLEVHGVEEVFTEVPSISDTEGLLLASSLSHVENGINSMGLYWLSSWLNALYTINLEKIPFIPLSDGTYSSVNEGFDGRHGLEAFPNLFAKLRTVNLPSFLHQLLIPHAWMWFSRQPYQLLHRIGVQWLSAHEIVKVHILPAGFQRLVEVPIHFSKNMEIQSIDGLLQYYSGGDSNLQVFFYEQHSDVQWVVSGMDDELHYPKDLFYDCEAVRSILGASAPYAVPKVLRGWNEQARILLPDSMLSEHLGLGFLDRNIQISDS
ncbi:hypothetical protein CFP56_031056 [Quercus suber]|uniref:Histidine kinase-, DNA gyrase B-, and HSP90-like ATPase family protein n=1 Tax=Quercus suber TaxID=58331 RepID=A0AAW0LTG8_QUESU